MKFPWESVQHIYEMLAKAPKLEVIYLRYQIENDGIDVFEIGQAKTEVYKSKIGKFNDRRKHWEPIL